MDDESDVRSPVQLRWPAQGSFLDRTLAYVVASAVAYVAADRFLTVDGVGVWFPPAALTLAYLVTVGTSGAPVALATRLVLATTVMGAPFSLRNSLVSAALIVGTYTVAARWLRPRLEAATSRLDAVEVLLRGGATGALGAAVTSIGYLVVAGPTPVTRLPVMVGEFWLGDASAVITLVPLLLLGSREAGGTTVSFRLKSWHGAAVVGEGIAIIGTAYLAVGLDPSSPTFYPAFVPLVWIAMRRGLHATNAALVLTGLAVPSFTLARGGSIGDMTAVQLFLLVYSVTGLVLAAAEGDRRAARMLLSHSEARARADHESLKASEATQRATLEALEQGIAFATLDGEVRLLNPAGQQILGRSATEVTELLQSGNWHTFDEDGNELAAADRPITQALTTGQPVSERVVGWRRPEGTLVILRVAIEPLRDDTGELSGVVIAFADITHQRAIERAEQEAVAQLAWQAFHDQLTGLANRAMLMEHLERTLADPRDEHHLTGVLYVDLDHFKLVNDTLGHDAGDELLVAIANRLRSAVREGDLVARFGGDEFVVVATGLASVDTAMELARRIGENLAAPVEVGGRGVDPSASIGLAVAAGQTADELLRHADAALYRAKQSGRNRAELFDDHDGELLTVSTFS